MNAENEIDFFDVNICVCVFFCTIDQRLKKAIITLPPVISPGFSYARSINQSKTIHKSQKQTRRKK